jgi:FtsH-binding integral membrane protein
MSWRNAVFNVVICALLFMAGFAWTIHTIFFGGEAEKRLVLKLIIMVGAIVVSAEAVRHAGEDEFCAAALLSVYALLMALGAIFAL